MDFCKFKWSNLQELVAMNYFYWSNEHLEVLNFPTIQVMKDKWYFWKLDPKKLPN